MQSITEKRPATPHHDEAYLDLKQFVSYLRGETDESRNTESINVPMNVEQYITEKIKSMAPVKSIARITSTTAEKLDVVIDRSDFNQSGWITDNKISSDYQTNIKKISIELHELYARPRVTQRFIDDRSIRIEDFIKEKIVSQMASAENKAFLFGDGISQPHGILKYGLSYTEESYKKNDKTIEAVKTGANGQIPKMEHLVSVMEKLPSEYLHNAVWLMSRNAASTIRFIRDHDNKRFIWNDSLTTGIPATLLGYPVVISDDMPKLLTERPTTPVLFGNLYEAYQIAERPHITLLKDPYNSKPFVEFYATKRIGGDIINFDAIKVLRCEQ
ncbi:MAG: phage major capsid protein [Holosporales bacterium]|jgi:HK97 family phage major capsid protein|nr:phage major capsid protein [Holosporales bacterium]